MVLCLKENERAPVSSWTRECLCASDADTGPSAYRAVACDTCPTLAGVLLRAGWCFPNMVSRLEFQGRSESVLTQVWKTIDTTTRKQAA